MSTEMITFETDSKWFYENVSHLRAQKLVGNFVAIYNKQVIASNTDIKQVITAVEGKGKNPAYLVIEFVHPEGTVVLL